MPEMLLMDDRVSAASLVPLTIESCIDLYRA